MARRRFAEALQALALLAAFAGICVGQSPQGTRPCDPQAPFGPSHDLYCIDLIAAPGARGASGRVELSHPAGPFTVGVTPDGHSRYTLIGTVAGLAPGPTYVVWIMTPQLDSIIKLGAIARGAFVGRDIALDKFVVLVTAEQNARVRAPGDRIVLRGQSPSTRLFPPDQLTFAAGGSTAPAAHEHEDHGDWPMVPMPANLTMLPAEMALRPRVAPYRVPANDTLPLARASERRRLATGDTLWLDAGVVRGGFAFNGQQPGPLLEVTRGSEIVVAFRNHLPDSTAIHWHGIRLDNRSDGVPGLTQPAIPPGGTFFYRIRFPDAGIYWYHPHVREDIQQDLGLYGNILVPASPPDSALAPPPHREEFLMLDDVLVGDEGQIPPGRESPTHALMGRFGNVFIVNGKRDYQLTAGRGEVVRFYLTNAANARTMNLSFSGARMRLVAADAGAFAVPRPVESIVIAPAERYVVDVRFERPGRYALVNQVQGLDHLFGRFFPEVDTLGTVLVSSERVFSKPAGAFAAAPRRPSPPFAAESLANRPPDKTLLLTLSTQNLPSVTERLMQLDSIFFQPVEWSGSMPMMNWAATGEQVRWILRDPETGRENMDIDWHFRRGEPVKLRLVNERRAFHGMQHPIHLHGQRFLVLAVNGVPASDLVWKDTVLVPAGSTVDILFDTSNPGQWMLHCHIAEHLSAGMMMHLTVD